MIWYLKAPQDKLGDARHFRMSRLVLSLMLVLTLSLATGMTSAYQGGGGYTLQVGSTNDEAAARAQVAQLKAAGHTAYYVRAEIPGKGTWYRIRVGRFGSPADAQRYSRTLGGKSTFATSYDGPNGSPNSRVPAVQPSAVATKTPTSSTTSKPKTDPAKIAASKSPAKPDAGKSTPGKVAKPDTSKPGATLSKPDSASVNKTLTQPKTEIARNTPPPSKSKSAESKASVPVQPKNTPSEVKLEMPTLAVASKISRSTQLIPLPKETSKPVPFQEPTPSVDLTASKLEPGKGPSSRQELSSKPASPTSARPWIAEASRKEKGEEVASLTLPNLGNPLPPESGLSGGVGMKLVEASTTKALVEAAPARPPAPKLVKPHPPIKLPALLAAAPTSFKAKDLPSLLGAPEPQPTGWVRQYPTLRSDLTRVFFVDPARGWTAGIQGTVLSTEDGGETWNSQSVGVRGTVNDLFFIDRLRGWALIGGTLGTQARDLRDEQVLVKTEDGGKTWQRLAEMDALSVHFVSPHIGYAAGNYGALLKTENGGKTWARCGSLEATLNKSVKLQDAIFSFTRVKFLDSQTGWAIGNYYGTGSVQAGGLFSTHDGGLTWEKANVSLTASRAELMNVHFFDKLHGSLTAETYQGDSRYLTQFQTADGGKTWIERTTTFPGYHVTTFTDPSTGWTIGNRPLRLNGPTFETGFWKTQDGGQTWKEETALPGMRLYDVFFLESGVGWAVGERGLVLKYVPRS
ncbi:MAG: SPOR domain-containing protein [Acidobacteria bacterium]|nr:SPOR domain-containing protein [Acidobacteriota bacterium]